MFILFHPEVSLHFWLLWPMVWRGLASLSTSSTGPFGRSADPSFVLCNYFKEWNSMLGGHFSAPIDTGSGPVLSLAVCTAFRVGKRMSFDESKHIAYICRYPPQIFIAQLKEYDKDPWFLQLHKTKFDN